MKWLTGIVVTTVFFLGLAGAAPAQNWTTPQRLGDLARQLKAQRAKSPKKPRVFTNDDLVALHPVGDQPPRAAVGLAFVSEREVDSAAQNTAEASGNQDDYIDQMSRIQVTHPAPSPAARESRPETPLRTASPPTGEWNKAKFRAAGATNSVSSEPGPIAAQPVSLLPSPPREDLGYVERADGKVEAIVAEGEHVGLVEETKEFVQNFHIPAPLPAELEYALASPPPANPPAPEVPDTDQATQQESVTPAATGGVDIASLKPSEVAATENAEAETQASSTLQSEPLADYGSVQPLATPPEALVPPSCPPVPDFAPKLSASHSSVKPLGYVEKSGGEKEAIIEVADQVYLVHEGEVFADRFKALRITPLSVDIEEEPTRASSAQSQ